MEAFAPARALYVRHGFRPCAPFGEYVGSGSGYRMSRDLTATGDREG
jgi:hypothetical protein